MLGECVLGKYVNVGSYFCEFRSAGRACQVAGRQRSGQASSAGDNGAESIPPDVILGACDPPLAHRALSADPSIGLLLPCNVVVRAQEGRIVVEALDPNILVEVTGDATLSLIAAEAARRLNAAPAAVADAEDRPQG
ncbi:MAG TPA: DUF302 domain-containing protein [Actinospica sp.]|nr:DUF302 domain-containing protein [Actinospica sp.]